MSHCACVSLNLFNKLQNKSNVRLCQGFYGSFVTSRAVTINQFIGILLY